MISDKAISVQLQLQLPTGTELGNSHYLYSSLTYMRITIGQQFSLFQTTLKTIFVSFRFPQDILMMLYRVRKSVK